MPWKCRIPLDKQGNIDPNGKECGYEGKTKRALAMHARKAHDVETEVAVTGDLPQEVIQRSQSQSGQKRNVQRQQSTQTSRVEDPPGYQGRQQDKNTENSPEPQNEPEEIPTPNQQNQQNNRKQEQKLPTKPQEKPQNNRQSNSQMPQPPQRPQQQGSPPRNQGQPPQNQQGSPQGRPPQGGKSDDGSSLLPFGGENKINQEQLPDTNVEQEFEVIGSTVTFDDYKHFQESEAKASDLDSLMMLERSIAKGERPTGTNIMTYVGAVLALAIGGIIAYYIFQEVVMGGGGLPIPFMGGGSSGGGGDGGGGVVEYLPLIFLPPSVANKFYDVKSKVRDKFSDIKNSVKTKIKEVF